MTDTRTIANTSKDASVSVSLASGGTFAIPPQRSAVFDVETVRDNVRFISGRLLPAPCRACDSDELQRVAAAIKACVAGFHDPARLYIEHEARYRWEDANPNSDWYRSPESDDALASYKIIARAIIGKPE
jgi:hypothetical protein